MSVDEFSTALLRWSMHLAANDRAAWAQAMFAELPHAETRIARLQWSTGCSFLLLRQWMQRMLFHSTRSAWEGRSMKRSAMAVLLTCGILMGVLLCIPEFREGLGVARALARNTLGALRKDDSNPDLERMAARAKATHNADLLAYAALRNGEPGAIEWAKDAVNLDSTLTWIYAEFCGDMRWDITPECGAGIALLEERDGTNAMPFLLEAAHIAHKLDPDARALDKAPADARWRAVMATAFAAPRYDNYAKEYSELQRRVYVQDHESSLTQFAEGLFRSAVPPFGQPRTYAREVLADNPQATIDFARRVIAGSNSSFEQYLATNLLLQAYARANQIKPGSISELQVASDKRILTLSADRERTYFPMLDGYSRMFQVVVLCQAISCAALLVLLLAAGWQLGRRRAVGALLQTSLSVAAAALAFCSTAMLLIYRPFSVMIHNFIRNGNASSSLAPYPFVELYFPNRWLGPTSAGWAALLVLCGIALIAELTRAVRHRRATLKPVTP